MPQDLKTRAIVCALAAATSASALSAVITIGASRDATIYQNNVNNSNGAGPAMFAGTNGANSPRRSLLDFDIAGSVPAGATISDAQLTLFLAQVAGTDATPRTIDLHLLTHNWGEGVAGLGSTVSGSGQGFSAGTGDATWNANLFGTSLWAAPGADFSSTVSASTLVNQTLNAPFVWLSTPALVSNVQGWLNAPGSNFGWALMNANEATPTDFRAFFTRDCTTADPAICNATLVPQLRITYATAAIPEPSSLALLAIGVLGLVARRRHLGWISPNA